jgi:hypothetical protein
MRAGQHTLNDVFKQRCESEPEFRAIGLISGSHGEAHRDFSAIIGWKALSDSIQRLGKDSEFTKLVTNLKNKSPDDVFSSIPYERGACLLYSLEKCVGQEKFDKFIPYVTTLSALVEENGTKSSRSTFQSTSKSPSIPMNSSPRFLTFLPLTRQHPRL